jgi:inorganic pyrophosphatase
MLVTKHLEADFWNYLRELVDSCRVVIDRPKYTSHPRFSDLIYPLDYGYLEGTLSGDGGGLDVWVGSHQTKDLAGIILTTDQLKRDVEIKLLLGCTDEEISRILAFFDQNQMGTLLVRRIA